MSHAADVVVVGGGVIGCAVAYYASKRGLRVVLVDQPKRGRATSASAGGLWPLGESLGLGCGVIFHRARLAKHAAAASNGDVGEDDANPNDAIGPAALPETFIQFALQSRAMFSQLAVELRDASGMDVEIEETSLLFLMYDDADVSYAQRLREQRPDVFTADDWISPDDLARAESMLTRDLRGALRFRGDDQLNPYKLADALRAGARRRGATLVTHTEVTGLRLEGSRVVGVETRQGSIPCGVVVNAAGAWAAEVGRMAGIEIPVHPVRGQMVATDAMPEVLRACISTSDCYIAQKAHGEIIIGSTTEEAGFDAGVTPHALQSLCAGAVRAVPALAGIRLKRAWSGLRPGSPDELPILGRADGIEGYLNACGHFRTGIVTAPITGLMIAALAADDPSPHPLEPFLLSRFATLSG